MLGKDTDSTRQKSLRHLRELYALDEATPIFGLLRKLHAIDPASLPLLAVQVAWARDPLFRATTPPVLDASEGDRVETDQPGAGVGSRVSGSVFGAEPEQDRTECRFLVDPVRPPQPVARTRPASRIKPTAVAVTMALFLGDIAGYHGAAVFSNPWCRLLDLNPDRARSMGQEAHRAGLLNLRAVGEVVEMSFPLLAEFQGQPS